MSVECNYSAPRSSQRHGQLIALAIGQVVSWGVLYYGAIVASSRIAEQTGWSLTLVTGLFSMSVLISAVVGIPVGRLLDNRGPRVLMTLGSMLAVLGFVVVAVAPTPALFGFGWAIVGVAQSAVLYQAAFTVVTRTYGEQRRGPLMVITIAGGLSSAVFAPIVAALLSVTDWRGTFLVLAGILALITIPLHLTLLEKSWPDHEQEKTIEPASVAEVVLTRQFWMLELSTLAATGAIFTVTLAAIPLYVERGMSFELAAVGLALLGAGQLLGRLLFHFAPGPQRPRFALGMVGVVAAITVGLMGIVPGPPWALIAVGIVAGAVRGVLTLVQASAISDRWGTRNYGAINGIYAAPVTVVMALAPVIGPLVAHVTGSFSMMAIVMAVVAIVAAILARWS